MAHLVSLRKGKADMRACNDKGFFILLLICLKLKEPGDLGMTFFSLSLAHHYLQTKRFLGIRNLYNAVYGLIMNSRRNHESQIFEDGVDRIEEKQFTFRPEKGVNGEKILFFNRSRIFLRNLINLCF